MAVYQKFVDALDLAIEYDSVTKIASVINPNTQSQTELGKMTENGLKLTRITRSGIALKAIADKLWSFSHLKDASELKSKKLAETKKAALSDLLLDYRSEVNAVNDKSSKPKTPRKPRTKVKPEIVSVNNVSVDKAELNGHAKTLEIAK